MKKGKNLLLLTMFLSVFTMWACDGGGGGSSTDGIAGSAGTGSLSLSLTDNSTEEYKAVYITIKYIEVHLGGNENKHSSWRKVDLPTDPNTGLPEDRITLNLLELVNGVREDLGIVELRSGRYTQMRLIIDSVPDDTINILSQNHPYANYVIDQSNPPNAYELEIPSGFQTGFKIVGGFDINTNQTTELVLDFDACRSVVQAGASGKWLLKPTVKVGRLEDFSIINGTISESSPPNTGIEGALISAQIFQGGNTATKNDDVMTIQAATISDVNGNYRLFVKPGTYNLVVYAEDKVPDFRKITIMPGDVLVGPTAEDFNLSSSPTGTASGSVTIPGASAEQHATLSFLQLAGCFGCEPFEKIEIKAINVLRGTSYLTALPVGMYSLAASSFGYPTENPSDFSIADGTNTTVDVTF